MLIREDASNKLERDNTGLTPPLCVNKDQASMTSCQLLRRSLIHFWRTNLAVVLGVVVATAVIGGALIVGDSVRSSLRQITLNRLGKIDAALTGHRFVREELTGEIEKHATKTTVAPALVFTGGLERKGDAKSQASGEGRRRAGQVTVYGVDARAWGLINHQDAALPTGSEVILGSRTAAALSARVGEAVTLWLELPSSVPRDTLLGQRDNETAEVPLTVAGIAPEASGLSRLSLQANQQLPFTAFVNLSMLQDRLDLSAIKPSRRDPEGRPARINTLLASTEDYSPMDVDLLNKSLRREWTPTDLGLRVAVNSNADVVIVDSTQMILEEPLAKAVFDLAKSQDIRTKPVHVYLANWLRNAANESAYSMYSVVAGLDLLQQSGSDFGEWEFLGPRPVLLKPRDVILNEWVAEDLKVQVGETIRLGYHVVGSHGELPEESAEFLIAGIVKLTGPAADVTLTPHVKGITDATTFGNWQQPFPMKLDLVTKRDDAYWSKHRATPKAFVSLATAQDLWKSRYGNLTSIRLAPPAGQSANELRDRFVPQLMQTLDPVPLGAAFQPVKAQGLAAAAGSTDFTGLFVGFSFFLILAAAILIGLLFRLGIEQRVRHWGVLGAVGFSPRQIQRLMMLEGGVLALVGGLLGIPAAIGYARWMIHGLTTWWIGAIGTTELFLSVNVSSLLMGLAVSLTASGLAILWGERQLRTVSTRAQLTGVVEQAVSVEEERRRGQRAGIKAAIALGTAGVLVFASMAGLIPASEAFTGLGWPVVVFFVSGLSLLAASLWFLSARLHTDQSKAVRGHGAGALARLGLRNAARQRTRSVLTAGLIASAAFVIAAVAAGQINPTRQHPDKHSGNGGFTLVAESSRPILYDLNTPAGRKQLGILDKDGSPEASLWSQLKIVQFRVNPGEDASCLNLFQTRVPTILGTPQEMIDRGGFTFANAGRGNPWKLLNSPPDERTVPVLGDMNTLQFSLKKGIAAKIPVPNAEQPQFDLQVAGMFNGAVFQGVLLMSDEQFQRRYPERKGYQYFLVEVPESQSAAAIDLLESQLAPYGFDAEPVAERLARFLLVQNTYLSTFQTLGGLGLLLGTLGLATVMLRNVWERQAEIALLRAVGFPSSSIGQLVLWENAYLLTWGLIAGVVSAFVAMTPHLRSTGADVPWGSVLGLFAAVILFGMSAATLAIRFAVRVPIVATLRGE